jgi:metal-dependent amidase/aminoacylase/carboxypeptidase family protein
MGGGNMANLIPDTAVLEGGLRCFDPKIRQEMVAHMYQIIETMVPLLRGSLTMEKISTPSMVNDPVLYQELLPSIHELVGESNFVSLARPFGGTEDFSYVGARVPSLFLFVGAGRPGNYPLHNPNVVFDEEALPYGSAMLATCAMDWLIKQSTHRGS